MSSPPTDRSQLWRKALLSPDAVFQEAVENLNESTLKIVLVAKPDGTFVGTITDGDIRRGLLRGLNLQSPISSIVKHDAMVVPASMPRDAALTLMKTNSIGALPIVDEARRVTGLHHLEEMLSQPGRKNTVVIMAGGKGIRLRPFTEKCPKPLLPVNGKPMLEHILERAKAEGFTQFVISVHYLGHMIEEYFGDGSRWGVEIQYLHEARPLGTAGALEALKPRPDAPILVTNGDILTYIRYGELLDYHLRTGAAATMAVRLYEWKHPFGVVSTEGVDIVDFQEKPVTRSYVNAGIYVLEPRALDALRTDEPCDMPTLFKRLKDAASRIVVYPMHEEWVDFGPPEQFSEPLEIEE